jgi:hypothetical protein
MGITTVIFLSVGSVRGKGRGRGKRKGRREIRRGMTELINVGIDGIAWLNFSLGRPLLVERIEELYWGWSSVWGNLSGT